MVKPNVVEKFIRMGGYEIVKKKKGKWKNISEASKRTGLSRPTIYSLLAEFPEPPSKVKPKYVEQYELSEGYRRVKEMFEKALSKGEYQNTHSIIMRAWKQLNKKDAISWTKQDFQTIWNMEEFHDTLAGGFESHNATKFHRLMKAIGRYDLIPEFEGKARPLGLKKHWFLGDTDLIKLSGAFEQKDTLLFSYVGLLTGARASAILGLKREHINFEDKSITVYEPKVKKFVSKFPPLCLFELLKKYIEEKQLKPEDLFFANKYDYYNKALQVAGEKAGLSKKLSTHILKHTFVSQGHRHRLSRETVVEQTGTQDRTIKAHYLSVDEKVLRHEMQGLKLDTVPFYEWAEYLHQYFKDRYTQLKF